MYSVLGTFNSMALMLMNLSIALYTLKRFFRAMTDHCKLMAEVGKFNSTVCQSRQSLDYISSKVKQVMTEIKRDIEEELRVTDDLTKLGAKVSRAVQRFGVLEEGAVEFARMERNMENARVETPSDIVAEMKRVLLAEKKRKEQSRQLKEAKIPRRSRPAARGSPPSALSKFSTGKARNQLIV